MKAEAYRQPGLFSKAIDILETNSLIPGLLPGKKLF